MQSNVHATAIVDEGAIISPSARVWHFCHIRGGAIIEDQVSLARDVYVDRNVKICQGTRVQNGVSIYDGVTIKEWCFIGPHVIFTNDMYPRAGNIHWNMTKTDLEPGCSIGAGAIIRCGIKVGSFALIAAGAIVTKDVPPFTLVMGTPAREIARVCACGQSRFSLDAGLSQLISPCCMKNIKPEALRIAQDQVAQLKSSDFEGSLL